MEPKLNYFLWLDIQILTGLYNKDHEFLRVVHTHFDLLNLISFAEIYFPHLKVMQVSEIISEFKSMAKGL
jgi:hypothetical protein